MSTTSENYKLTLPAQTDFYDVDIFNENFRKLDTELKKVDNKAVKDTRIGDLNNLQTTAKDNLVNAINEVKIGLGNVSSDASGTSYTDTTTQLGATNVQKAIEVLASKIRALETELNGQAQRLNGINTELETEIGTPV